MGYFDEIKEGDEVWSFEYGWGTVNYVSDTYFKVKFSEFHMKNPYISDTFTYNGKKFEKSLVEEVGNQIIFWDKIQFDTPKKPK